MHKKTPCSPRLLGTCLIFVGITLVLGFLITTASLDLITAGKRNGANDTLSDEELFRERGGSLISQYCGNGQRYTVWSPGPAWKEDPRPWGILDGEDCSLSRETFPTEDYCWDAVKETYSVLDMKVNNLYISNKTYSSCSEDKEIPYYYESSL